MPARPAILAGSMLLPVESLPDPDLIRRRLTVESYKGPDEPATIIEAYALTEHGFLEVPRQFGINLCEVNGIPFEDHTSQGHPAHFPRMPDLRDYQVEPMTEVHDCMGRFYDFMFQARTGFGKTISMLREAALRGRTTLVLVDQENLRDQWIAALTEHFGFTRDNIGIIQGKRCDYQGKAVTIAMVQTLSRGRHQFNDVFAYFGTLIVDEVDAIGAPTFSMVLFDIPAEVRIGVSATPENRRDGTLPLLKGHLGEVQVRATAEHSENTVYIVRSYGTYSWYANVSSKNGRFLSEVCDDGARNLLFMDIMLWLYQTGRDTLVLSDRIEQLRHLMDLAYYMGVPEEHLGLYTGSDPHYQYAKDPTPSTDEPGQTEPVQRLQMISKAVPRRQLNEVKDRARMIFGTYGMFKKGVDIPRLCGGVDATPRSAAEQIHGRILRGGSSLKSIWVTVVDWNSYRSVHGSLRRIEDFARSNADIREWLEEGGSRQWSVESYVREARKRVKQLKQMEIRSHKDGRHELVTLTASERLDMLKRAEAMREYAKSRRETGETKSISASERGTRTTKSTGRAASAAPETRTGAAPTHRRVPSRVAGSPRKVR